jgi:predicted transposase YdaD
LPPCCHGHTPSGQPLATYGEAVEQQHQERLRAEQERLRAEQAEASQRAAVPRLLAMGLSVEQVAEALTLPLEMVSDLGGD